MDKPLGEPIKAPLSNSLPQEGFVNPMEHLSDKWAVCRAAELGAQDPAENEDTDNRSRDQDHKTSRKSGQSIHGEEGMELESFIDPEVNTLQGRADEPKEIGRAHV